MRNVHLCHLHAFHPPVRCSKALNEEDIPDSKTESNLFVHQDWPSSVSDGNDERILPAYQFNGAWAAQLEPMTGSCWPAASRVGWGFSGHKYGSC